MLPACSRMSFSLEQQLIARLLVKQVCLLVDGKCSQIENDVCQQWWMVDLATLFSLLLACSVSDSVVPFHAQDTTLRLRLN